METVRDSNSLLICNTTEYKMLLLFGIFDCAGSQDQYKYLYNQGDVLVCAMLMSLCSCIYLFGTTHRGKFVGNQSDRSDVGENGAKAFDEVRAISCITVNSYSFI